MPITREQIEARIVDTDYIRIGTTVTVCSILLDNGFSVRGESVCVDPADFDPAIGETIAQQRAFNALWPLFGFLLAEQRFIARSAAA